MVHFYGHDEQHQLEGEDRGEACPEATRCAACRACPHDDLCRAAMGAVLAAVPVAAGCEPVAMHLLGAALETAQAGAKAGQTVCEELYAAVAAAIAPLVVHARAAPSCPGRVCGPIARAAALQLPGAGEPLRLPVFVGEDGDLVPRCQRFEHSVAVVSVPYAVPGATLLAARQFSCLEEGDVPALARPHGVAFGLSSGLTLSRALTRQPPVRVRPWVDNCLWGWYAERRRFPSGVAYFLERLGLGVGERVSEGDAARTAEVFRLAEAGALRAADAVAEGVVAGVAVALRDAIPLAALAGEPFAAAAAAVYRTRAGAPWTPPRVSPDAFGGTWAGDVPDGAAALIFAAAYVSHQHSRRAFDTRLDVPARLGVPRARLFPLLCDVSCANLPRDPEALFAASAGVAAYCDRVVRLGSHRALPLPPPPPPADDPLGLCGRASLFSWPDTEPPRFVDARFSAGGGQAQRAAAARTCRPGDRCVSFVGAACQYAV